MINKLLSQWNVGVSHGIPVGPAASRLLAELAINDVDSALAGDGITYCRYSDDYRLFATSESDALSHLAQLAQVLQVNHGLSLNEGKTEVISCTDFIRRFKETDEQRERRELQARFEELLSLLEIDQYEQVDYEDLTPEDQEAVDALNLEEIVRTQIVDGHEVDPALTGFALRRLAQVGGVSGELADLLLDSERGTGWPGASGLTPV